MASLCGTLFQKRGLLYPLLFLSSKWIIRNCLCNKPFSSTKDYLFCDTKPSVLLSCTIHLQALACCLGRTDVSLPWIYLITHLEQLFSRYTSLLVSLAPSIPGSHIISAYCNEAFKCKQLLWNVHAELTRRHLIRRSTTRLQIGIYMGYIVNRLGWGGPKLTSLN